MRSLRFETGPGGDAATGMSPWWRRPHRSRDATRLFAAGEPVSACQPRSKTHLVATVGK